MPRLSIFMKMKILTVIEFAFFSLLAEFDEFFFDKKGCTKRYIDELKKLNTLVYNTNFYLIVPIDRALQRLYSQR